MAFTYEHLRIAAIAKTYYSPKYANVRDGYERLAGYVKAVTMDRGHPGRTGG